VGAFNGDKGELVGIADGEYSYRLSPEFTVRLAKVTLSDLDNNVTGVLAALPRVKSK
jgi:hypothetical protein